MEENTLDKYGWVIMLILLGVGVLGTLLLISRKTGTGEGTGTYTSTGGTSTSTTKRKVTICAYANRLYFPDETSSCDIVIKSGNTEIGAIHYDKLDYFNPEVKSVYLEDGDYTLVCYCPSKDYPKTTSYTDIHVVQDMTVEVWADLPEPEGYMALTLEILNKRGSGYERPFEWEYKLDDILDEDGSEVPLYEGTTMLDRGVITALLPKGINLRYIMLYRYDEDGNEVDHLIIWTNIKTNTDILARLTALDYTPVPGKVLYEIKVFDKGIPVSVGAYQISVYSGENPTIENLVYSLDTYGEKGMVGVVQFADGNIGKTVEVFVKDKSGNTTYAHITESINTSVVYVLVDHTYKWR